MLYTLAFKTLKHLFRFCLLGFRVLHCFSNSELKLKTIRHVPVRALYTVASVLAVSLDVSRLPYTQHKKNYVLIGSQPNYKLL